ncbi:MAG: uroporphyrinogen-III C-methyltransferase [Deltaproteobacteria bacterium]|nr:uroporphyrinogen-III C-methyltransferase [Deltaproteobacteria bacterium]
MSRRQRLRPGVYLVGAGPGDPELITVRGLEYLRRADAIIYDDLVSPRLLKHARLEAELIHIGRRHTGEHLSQAAVNELMVARYRRGRAVVRLKGGDPLIFGRGGEELSALAEAGVPFEVVPGVSAALAAAAQAGIPLTDRRCASVVSFVTAHQGDGNARGVDWQALARLKGTLAVFMGARRLGAVVRRLLSAGRSPEEPAAIVASATTPDEKIVLGRLGDLDRLAEAAKITAPALALIGPVVGLRAAAPACAGTAVEEDGL